MLPSSRDLATNTTVQQERQGTPHNRLRTGQACSRHGYLTGGTQDVAVDALDWESCRKGFEYDCRHWRERKDSPIDLASYRTVAMQSRRGSPRPEVFDTSRSSCNAAFRRCELSLRESRNDGGCSLPATCYGCRTEASDRLRVLVEKLIALAAKKYRSYPCTDWQEA